MDEIKIIVSTQRKEQRTVAKIRARIELLEKSPAYTDIAADIKQSLEAAVELRRVVATEFKSCVAMRADIEMGCHQCTKWDGEGCEYDSTLELLDETTWLVEEKKRENR